MATSTAIGSLSTCAFETRAATGSELFSLLEQKFILSNELIKVEWPP